MNATNTYAAELRRLIRTEGGFTTHIEGHRLLRPADGFAVALLGHTLVVPFAALTTDTIARYINHNRMQLNRPGIHLGAWTDPAGAVWLDLSEVHPNRRNAMAAARSRNEIAIYDLHRGIDIPVSHVAA